MTDTTAATWDRLRKIVDDLEVYLAGTNARAQWRHMHARAAVLEKTIEMTSARRCPND